MTKIITTESEIDQILERGTIQTYLPTKEGFRDLLLSGKQLTFYIGIDATAPVLHLSHAKNFLLLEKFRLLGHKVIVLFGDFTARIGDPSGKHSARKRLTAAEVKENVQAWREQIKSLMDFEAVENPPQIKFNNDWLAKLTFEEIIDLAGNFTVQQFLERDMFQKRLEQAKPIYLNEFLYPLLQGYDSVALEVDIELCGTDQIFNALAGRTLLQKLKDKEKMVVAVTLMENPKTGELMSKSKGTGVFLNTGSLDLFGQVMAQPDEMIEILFRHCTLVPLPQIEEIMSQANPRDSKMQLAWVITKLIHDDQQADYAQSEFIKTIQQKELPSEITEFEVVDATQSLVELLVATKLVSSKAEAKRVIDQKGIKVAGEVVDHNKELLIPSAGLVLQKGKRHFVKVVVTK